MRVMLGRDFIFSLAAFHFRRFCCLGDLPLFFLIFIMEPFHAFGLSHRWVLVVAVALWWIFFWLRGRWVERVFAVCLGAAWPFSLWAHGQEGSLSLENMLPLHLCDVAALCGCWAMWSRSRWAAEVLYFVGLAGTLQAVITPNLQWDFPAWTFWNFFISHLGIVMAALYAVTAMALRPRPGAARRVFGLTLLYACGVGAVNAWLGTNFAFLCRKPAEASLMDSLGPWPWYIFSLVGLCGLGYAVLALPFFRRRSPEGPSSGH
jgi:hypothetical integral membrane protein (TIGR02206 family)